MSEWKGEAPPEITTEYYPAPRKKLSKFSRIAILIVVLVLVFFGAAIFDGVRSIPPPPSNIAGLPAKNLTAAEHITEAEVLLKNKNATVEEVIRAKLHAGAVPKTAPEYQRAATLMTQANAMHKKLAEKEEIERNPVVVISSRWKKGGFGAVGIWTVVFENRSDKPAGDIQFETEYYSETGNRVSRTRDGLIQKVIPPKGKRTIEINDGLIHSEAESASFEVKGWKFVSP